MLPACQRAGARLLMADAPPAKADVAAVARLRAAGAVVIGKTTTTEFAHSLLGVSPLTGLTRNPWAPALTCGGSSAGAGVSVATGVAPLALATDAGCSTRLPAACTGVYGLKPTLGAAPHDRVPEAFANFIHLGLLAGSVRDLARGLDAIAGPYAGDPYSLMRPPPNASAGLDQPVLAGARVLLWMTTGNARVAAEMADATRAAAVHPHAPRRERNRGDLSARQSRSGLADPATVELRRALCHRSSRKSAASCRQRSTPASMPDCPTAASSCSGALDQTLQAVPRRAGPLRQGHRLHPHPVRVGASGHR